MLAWLACPGGPYQKCANKFLIKQSLTSHVIKQVLSLPFNTLIPNMQTNQNQWISIIQSRSWTPPGCIKIKEMRLKPLFLAILALTVTAVMSAPQAPLRLTPAMEETLRAVIEEQLALHPEMKFNVTRLREIEENSRGKDGTNDDTVRCYTIFFKISISEIFDLVFLAPHDCQDGISIWNPWSYHRRWVHTKHAQDPVWKEFSLGRWGEEASNLPPTRIALFIGWLGHVDWGEVTWCGIFGSKFTKCAVKYMV